MKLRMVIACGMLLGLLSSVSYAQRMHLGPGAAHGTVPGARMPIAVPADHIGTADANVKSTPNAKPTATTKPNSVTSTGASAQTRPSAKTDPTASTVRPSAGVVPDRVTGPDGNAVDGRTTVGPAQ
jgi:hypothetical protein